VETALQIRGDFSKNTTDNMDPLVTTAVVADLVVVLISGLVAPARLAFDAISLYGLPGLVWVIFGGEKAWKLEAEVLGSLSDGTLNADYAFSFKKTVSAECTMISVAVSNSLAFVFTLHLRLLNRQPW